MPQRQGVFFVDPLPLQHKKRKKSGRAPLTLGANQTVFSSDSIFGFLKPSKKKPKIEQYKPTEENYKIYKHPAPIKDKKLPFKKIKISKLQRLKGKKPTEKQKREFERLKKQHNRETVEEARELSERYSKELKFKKTARNKLNELSDRGMIGKIEKRKISDFKDAAELEKSIKYLKKQNTQQFKKDRTKKLKEAFITAMPLTPEKGTISGAIKQTITRMSREDFYDFIMKNSNSVSEFWALYHALTDRPDNKLSTHERNLRRRLHYKSNEEINSVLQDLAFTLEDYGMSKKWTR